MPLCERVLSETVATRAASRHRSGVISSVQFMLIGLTVSLDVSTEHIEVVQGAGGPKARIRGSRIRVIDVVDWYEGLGWSADRIISEFPQLSKAEIFAALAFTGTIGMRSRRKGLRMRHSSKSTSAKTRAR